MMAELYNADPTATCWTDEATWQSAVATNGICGQFVYDSVNNTLRLPKYGSQIYSKKTTAVEMPVKSTNNLGSSYALCVPASNSDQNYAVTSVDGSGLVYITSNSSSTKWFTDISTLNNDSLLSAYYYLVVGTVSKTDIQIDIDNVMTDLANKADRDLSNVPSSKGILVESYRNGASWYRVYSDGFCEQGGEQSIQGGTSPTTVTLLKPYINTNYSVLCTVNGYSLAWVAGYDKTQTDFKWYTVNNSGSGYLYSGSWYACGYIS